MYPECGWVMYDVKSEWHDKFLKTWTDFYTTDSIFKELEFHDLIGPLEEFLEHYRKDSTAKKEKAASSTSMVSAELSQLLCSTTAGSPCLSHPNDASSVAPSGKRGQFCG